MKKNMYDILTESQIKLKSYEGNEKTKCPECQPPHNKNDNPLSVTCDNGNAVWNCHHCGWTGSTNTGSTNFVTAREKVYVAPKLPEKTETPSSMYSWFAERGISKETVQKKGIYIEDKYWIAFPYKDEEGKVVNIKYRTQSKKFKQSPNAKRSLYNYDLAKDEEIVIFVEGEMDCLAMIEAGFDNVVTLPDGAPKEAKFNEKDARFTALENCPLDNAKKVILFVDNDSAGRALNKELLHRFGKELCWYVDYPSDAKDANEVLLKHGVSKITEIIQNAKPYPIDGLFSAHQYYGSVLDLYNGNYTKPISIGYQNLDEIYKVLRQTFCVVTGIPNHGKSSFLDQCLIKISEKHNWRFAVFSPEHSVQMHLRRLVQLKLGKAFDEGFANRMTKEELQGALEWINEHFYFIETKDTTPDVDYIIEKAKGAVLKYGCDGLVIDPYNEVSAVRKGNMREDEHIRDFISKLKRFGRIHDACVWVVAHPTKLQKDQNGSYPPPSSYEISGSSHWSNQSDVILTVHRDFDTDVTRVITRKIREQGLYGRIGEATFKYNKTKKNFEIYKELDVVDIPHWTDEDYENIRG